MAKIATYVALSVLFYSLFSHTRANAENYNIMALGATRGGKIDSSDALLGAWKLACASNGSSVIYVPTGRFLIEKPVEFVGPCQGGPIGIRIDGSLVAPSDYKVIGNAYSWLSFRFVNEINLSGGTLDGQGIGLWKRKASPESDSDSFPTGAMTLLLDNSNNIVISRLTSINSQMFHIMINSCANVTVQGAKIFAHELSPNTDGIHMQYSTNVTIMNTRIATGDDCISITQGTSNVWVENVMCGPGHGISIGSLGKSLDEEGVENVTVARVVMKGTTNGVRIKTWGRPSKAYARNIWFRHVVMSDVENPIIIDQNYCPNNVNCPGQDSGVQISNVTYEDITGTSASRVAVKFDCSPGTPCTGIQLKDVSLTYKKGTAEASCVNVDGTSSGLIQPANCL